MENESQMENEEYDGYSFCQSCGTISREIICNECGERSVPAPEYCEVGHTHCHNCGATYKYSVGKCSSCNSSFTN